MSKWTDSFAPFLPWVIIGAAVYLWSSRFTDWLCKLPGNPLGCATGEIDPFGCSNDKYWCESKNMCVSLAENCCTINPMTCENSGMTLDLANCMCKSKPIPVNPQFTEAQRLVTKLNANQCASSSEVLWLQSNEPSLYNMFRDKNLFCQVVPPSIEPIAPFNCGGPGYPACPTPTGQVTLLGKMCYLDGNETLRVPQGQNCYEAMTDMCNRYSGNLWYCTYPGWR